MARRGAAIILDLGAEQPRVEDVHDAMGELINIIAGNVNGVLSGSNHLSLPAIIHGNDFKLRFPRHVLLSEVAFSHGGEPVVVILLGEDKLGVRLEPRAGVVAGD